MFSDTTPLSPLMPPLVVYVWSFILSNKGREVMREKYESVVTWYFERIILYTHTHTPHHAYRISLTSRPGSRECDSAAKSLCMTRSLRVAPQAPHLSPRTLQTQHHVPRWLATQVL